MKYIAHGFLVLVGLGAAFLRWIDLVNFTDLETGFVTAGSIWWRYGLIAVLVLLALIASLMAARRPASLEGGCIPTGVFALVLSVLCAAYNAVVIGAAVDVVGFRASGLSALAWAQTLDLAGVGIAALGLLCAVWLFAVALSLFGKGYRLPAGGVGLGIVGSFYFYAMLIVRFADNQSSYHRLDPTLAVFVAAALIWFFALLLRAVYYPESGVGRKLYFASMSAFYLCVSMGLPQVICDFMVENITVESLCEQLLLVAFGALGACYATRCLTKELAQ